MRFRTYVLVFGALALVSAAAAADDIGAVSASGDVKVRGETVPGAAAQGIALKSGDAVETTETPAVIVLNGQGQVTVGKDSLVKVVRTGGKAQVGVERGTIHFHVKSGSKVQLCANSRLIELSAPSAGSITVNGTDPVQATADEGTVRVNESVACNVDGTPAKWLTKNKAVVIVGTAAAAGTAAGVGLSRPGPPPETPPVSPH